MSERCERTSERRSEWPSTLRVDFTVILPTVRSFARSLTHSGAYGEMVLVYEINASISYSLSPLSNVVIYACGRGEWNRKR